MAKYQVLKPIELGGVLYVPKDAEAPELVPSAAHGKDIPVNKSGVIELTDDQAAPITAGAIPLYQGKPDPIGAAAKREKAAAAKNASDKAAADAAAAEFEEFKRWKAAKK